MKKISVMIPCYNEEENVVPMSEAIVSLFETELTKYDYELLFIDNNSTDSTRSLLREICAKNSHIKAIFNAKNFGQFNSPYYGMCQTTGDCTIGMCCDFQDPVELIPQFIQEWEKGYKIVCPIKNSCNDPSPSTESSTGAIPAINQSQYINFKTRYIKAMTMQTTAITNPIIVAILNPTLV